MVTQSWQASADLARVSATYWGELTPDKLTQAAEGLMRVWESERAALVKISETDLPAVLKRLQVARETFLTTGGMYADAVRISSTVEADKSQATSALNDDAIKRMLGEMNDIVAKSPSRIELPRTLSARVDELRGELQHPAPDYKAINLYASQLRKEAEAFLADHRQRMQQARADLGQMKARLSSHQRLLKNLNDDPGIDFAPLTVPVLNTMGRWVGGFDAIAAMPYDETQHALAQGNTILRDANTVMESASAVSKHVSDKTQAARSAMAELNGVLSSAQAGLKVLSSVDGDDVSAALLDSTRRPLTEALELLNRLEQPSRRLAPDDAVISTDKIVALVATARAQADDAHAEIARRVNESRAGK